MGPPIICGPFGKPGPGWYRAQVAAISEELRLGLQVLGCLGSPVVPFYPFSLWLPLLKPNSRKKGTLIIKRLRGNLGYAGIYGSSLLGFGLKGPSLWLSALFISSSAIVAFPRDSDTECTLNCNGLHVVIHAILLVLGVLGSTPSPNANTSSIKHEHNHCYRGLQRRYVQYAPVVTEMSYCK